MRLVLTFSTFSNFSFRLCCSMNFYLKTISLIFYIHNITFQIANSVLLKEIFGSLSSTYIESRLTLSLDMVWSNWRSQTDSLAYRVSEVLNFHIWNINWLFYKDTFLFDSKCIGFTSVVDTSEGEQDRNCGPYLQPILLTARNNSQSTLKIT